MAVHTLNILDQYYVALRRALFWWGQMVPRKSRWNLYFRMQGVVAFDRELNGRN